MSAYLSCSPYPISCHRVQHILLCIILCTIDHTMCNRLAFGTTPRDSIMAMLAHTNSCHSVMQAGCHCPGSSTTLDRVWDATHPCLSSTSTSCNVSSGLSVTSILVSGLIGHMRAELTLQCIGPMTVISLPQHIEMLGMAVQTASHQSSCSRTSITSEATFSWQFTIKPCYL